MTTLESKIHIGNLSFSVTTCLANMRCAFNKDEALRWGFCVKTAFLEFGFNPEIDDVMGKILASKGVPPIVAEPENHSDGDIGMPPVLINKIFKTGFDQEQLKYLWCWIKENIIDNISFPYQYLSLLLFLEKHHSLFLQKPHISNTDMQDQMASWYSISEVKCSADSLGTYRNGFFSDDSFKYNSWLAGNGVPPIDYIYKKDQTLSGFQALYRLCNDLELNMQDLKI